MEKKVTLYKNQLLLLSSGEIIEAKASKPGMSILSYANGYKPEKIKKVKESSSNIVEFLSGQGRSVKCSETTSFVKWSLSNYVAVARYIPIFGKELLDDMEIDCLVASLLFNQDKRPNQYITQSIPLYLSKLNKETLTRVIKKLRKHKSIKHLSRRSKNILMILFERLAIPFDGKSDHTAAYPTGTIKFLMSNKNRTNYLKRESLLKVSESKRDNVTLSFSNNCDTILIGSFLCQVT
jgi:hypothetical protein